MSVVLSFPTSLANRVDPELISRSDNVCDRDEKCLRNSFGTVRGERMQVKALIDVYERDPSIM